MAMRQKRPGTMIYFDLREPLKFLTVEEKGRLLDAILDYGELGSVPDFEGALAMCWAFVQPKIDRDGEQYQKSVDKRKYAVYCREEKKSGREPIGFDDWYHVIPHDTGRYPTTTPSSTPSPSPTASPAAAAKGEGPGEGRGDWNHKRNAALAALEGCLKDGDQHGR